MPSINMIAPRRAEKRRLEMAMRKLAAVILIEIVFAAALGGWVITKGWTTRAHISVLQSQIQALQPKIKKIEETDRMTAELKPKVELLNQAKDKTMHWYNTLDRLTQSMPPSTWLTRISTNVTPQKEMVLNLNGMASDQGRVGETMIRLHGNPDFKSVDLHFTQKSTQGLSLAVEFEIGATLASEESKSKEVAQNGSGQS